MNNIKQVTEQNIPKDYDKSTYTFTLAEGNNKVIKVGYVCEPKGIKIPIMLNDKAIEIGKSGIYEGQTESYLLWDATDSKTANVSITTVTVPVGIKFTLDYVLAT